MGFNDDNSTNTETHNQSKQPLLYMMHTSCSLLHPTINPSKLPYKYEGVGRSLNSVILYIGNR